ncbi:MAG: hypothetical protein IJC83_02125, partial [Oscillospiraceae bacterium]|nr:hypothetical protein [Oscillospiraceae bacterium]
MTNSKSQSKVISLILAIALVMTMFVTFAPTNVLAAEGEPITPVYQTMVPSEGEADNDERFALYVEQQFYGYEMSTFGTRGRASLTGDTLSAYDALAPIIKDIAAGRRASTIISLGQTVPNVDMGDGNIVTLTPDITMTFTEDTFTNEQFSSLIDALLLDYPYEMYWYDKTSGSSSSMVGEDPLLYLEFKFPVAAGYRTDTYTSDT